jgi:type VI secretion system secreted protein Hcp
MKSINFLLTCLMLFLFVEIGSAQKGFIKMGDIKGESTDRDHKDWIVIESFNQDMEKGQTMTGAARRRTNVNFKDIVFSKVLDKSSPKLMEACAKGMVIPDVEMDMVGADGKTFYKVILNKVAISGVRSVSNCNPHCEVREEVSLNFSKITWEYSDGRGGKVTATYNVEMGY